MFKFSVVKTMRKICGCFRCQQNKAYAYFFARNIQNSEISENSFRYTFAMLISSKKRYDYFSSMYVNTF